MHSASYNTLHFQQKYVPLSTNRFHFLQINSAFDKHIFMFCFFLQIDSTFCTVPFLQRYAAEHILSPQTRKRDLHATRARSNAAPRLSEGNSFQNRRTSMQKRPTVIFHKRDLQATRVRSRVAGAAPRFCDGSAFQKRHTSMPKRPTITYNTKDLLEARMR